MDQPGRLGWKDEVINILYELKYCNPYSYSAFGRFVFFPLKLHVPIFFCSKPDPSLTYKNYDIIIAPHLKKPF